VEEGIATIADALGLLGEVEEGCFVPKPDLSVARRADYRTFVAARSEADEDGGDE
jgi:hypothetical protein